MTCKNCGQELQGDFCYICGQKVIKNRITVRFLLQSLFQAITNFDKGFWYTTKMLFTAPHTMVKDYWNGKRVPYYSPLRFLLIWATISVLLNLWLGAFEVQQADIQDMMGTASPDKGVAAMQEKINSQMKKYMNFMVFLQLPFYGLVAFLFFKKKGFYYAEHLVAMTYFLSAASLISIFLLIGLSLIPGGLHYFMVIGVLIYPIYYTYAYKRLFELSWWTSFWKSVLIFILGMLGFIIALSIVMIIVMFTAVIFFGFRPT